MKKLIPLSFVLLFVVVASAPAATRLVPSQYFTIQMAINDSSHGDVVIVEPGTYYEVINFKGKNSYWTGHKNVLHRGKRENRHTEAACNR